MNATLAIPQQSILVALPPADEMEMVDRAEAIIATCPPAKCSVVHDFTPGMYIRHCFMPAGTWLSSEIHLTEHPYVITQGLISVRIGKNVGLYKAPYHGITKPGTRRLLLAHEDTVWTTYHATSLTDVEEIERTILFKRENPYLEGGKP